MRNRPSAPELFLDGLTSIEPELPPHAGLGALERRLTDWVDRGLERRSSAPWLLSLRLDERARASTERRQLVRRRARAVAAGGRRPDPGPPHLPPARRRRRRVRLPPLGRSADRRAPPARADRARPRRGRPRLRPGRADDDRARATTTFASCSARRSRGSRSSACPCCCRGTGSARPAGCASTSPRRARRGRSSGLLTTDALARFDWKLAIGDTTLTEEELAELAAAKEPLIRIRGRWHALRRSEVERALLFLDRRREGSVVDLVRAVSGDRARGRRARARRGRRSTTRSARCSRAATSAASSRSARRPR